ncbi:putative DNA mismatch repair protein [Aspergillus tanneri]|uniref:DNA mismatch repair protein S5 domain-containing protein n=1 Tax=Aspergillus tanneri TaxID=1220188 RepID=A0A5M9MN84_9EURO|nr:uncharacterized protein ATNIH1004_004323 [Aspergillus tanneri]KAA8648438.1 hypothetical protein ATNIH1004_004323 [Aspergillus tanneri]
MSITALPQSAVQAIGSTSVISDPCSIVKELLDNALDAFATSVGIEISQNTLDVVQVKDNGHGIPSNGHAFVCRRTFTSKIQTLENLAKVGGKTLGFRGEALASAAEVSGGVNIFTRVETELVGSSIKYGRKGELISSERTSHPVGTTVRITDLFRYIPVRRQASLKNPAKTIAKIKRMIQSYAMCYPSKRLSLKILKARTDNNNWVYAPGQSATLMDAALKVAGTDVASNCIEKKWPPEESMDADQLRTEYTVSDYRLVSLLPGPNSEFTKMNNTGQYLSIDGRPISSTLGIGQDIVKIYKSYIRTAASGETSRTTANPFLCLQIRCPEASYDVNIEPAKDDVLFENPQRVLSIVEDLFRATYGEKGNSSDKRLPPKDRKAPNDNRFELLLARREGNESTLYNDMNTGSYLGPFKTARSLTRQAHSNSPIQSREYLEIPEAINAGVQKDLSDQEALNPWSLAKPNTPILQGSHNLLNKSGARLSTCHPVRSPGEKRKESRDAPRKSSLSSFLPTPSESPNSSSISPASTTTSQISKVSPTKRRNGHYDNASRDRDKQRYGNGALDTWFGKITQATLPWAVVDEPLDQADQPLLTELTREKFEQPSKETEYAPPGLSTPDPSVNRQDTLSSSELESQRPREMNIDSRARGKRQQQPVLEQWSARLHQLSKSGLAGLEDALDFENRKKEAIQKRRENVKNGSFSKGFKSPHLSRYLAARAALAPVPETLDSANGDKNPQIPLSDSRMKQQAFSNATSKSNLSPFDPRSYLMRRQSHQRGDISRKSSVRHINTNKLPFETIPEDQELHSIGLKHSANMSLMSKLFKITYTPDLYTRTGVEFESFATSDLEPGLTETWANRLYSMIEDKYKSKEGSTLPSVQFNFSALLRSEENP